VLHGYRAAGFGWITVPGLAAYRFGERGDVSACRDGGNDEALEDTWFRSVLPLVLQARGTQVLHASAVLTPRGVLALCGMSTSGKSTLAWALERRGHDVVADDALAFTIHDGRAAAHAVPHRLRLRADVLERYGVPQDNALREPPAGPHRLAAVAVLERGARLERIPLDSAEAVVALLPHAYCFTLDDTAGKATLANAYMRLADAIPVTRLVLPDGHERLEEILDAVEALAQDG